jgi:hypothetical protein
MAVLQKIVLGKVKEVFPLSPGTTRIGRGNGNELLLTPAAASKAHARIECFEDHCEISDLDSRNGTLVNGVRISSGYRLQHGDRLDFAGAKFVYLESEAKGSQLEDDEDSLGLSSNVFLNPLKIHTPMPDDHDPEQSIRRKIVRAGDFVSPDDLMEFPRIEGPRVIATVDMHALPVASWNHEDSARKVSHILRLTQAIIAYSDHQRINDVLEIMLEFFPAASHALVAIEGETADGFRIMGAVSRQNGDAVFLCHPLVRRAVTDCEGLLVTDHWRNEPNSQPKLTDLNRQWLLCVPIPGPVRTCRGAIQLQANDPSRPFSDTDLQRLAILSFILGATLPGFRHLA